MQSPACSNGRERVAGVLVVAGPTASGKTALALELALRFDAEIVGADSRQIYRGMEIGTASPTAEELARVPHHLVGFLSPHERYSAARFAREATAAVEAIAARGRRAIVVGGTGFYVRALCGDVSLSNAYDPQLRARLAREAALHPPEVLHDWLRARDPRRAAEIAAGDGYRVVRALEIALSDASAASGAGSGEAAGLRAAGIPFLKVVLDVEHAALDAAIAARVDRMLARGLVEEAERVGLGAVAADAVGYPDAIAFARGWSSPEELRSSLVRRTRRYAKRQRTWFRSEPAVTWVERDAALETVSRLARELPGWG
jgi:tRNA dimethylallyltransferase